MPTYKYVCQECGAHFERRLRYDDIHQVQTCPAGHPNARRVFTVPTVVFKGPGFYSTDNQKPRPASD